MVKQAAAVLLLCVMLGTGVAMADNPPARRVDLMMPRDAAANETATLAVQAGFLPRGTEIDVSSPDGRLIGTISPFAIADHQSAGTYNFPLRLSDIRDGRVSVLLTLRRFGAPTRAPTEAEVPRVSVVFTRTAP